MDRLRAHTKLLSQIAHLHLWGRTALILISLVLLSMPSGCDYLEGYAVQDYLKKVNEIQHSSDSMLLNLDQDLNSLGGELGKVEETTTRLKTERDEIEAARIELESLEAPEAAKPLKGHLLDLYARGAAIVGDLAATGNYRISIEPLITEYEASSRTFSEKVKTANDKNALSVCLREYEASVAGINKKTQTLEPPVLSLHAHKRFISNLKTLQAGLSETIAGLETEDPARLEAASKQMAEVDGKSEEIRQQINTERNADIRDYNARIQRMSELIGQIGQDQVELHERFDKN